MSIAWNKGKIIYKQCLHCNKQIRQWSKYCSQECYRAAKPKPVYIEKICLYCKKSFKVRLSKKKHNCCSDECGARQSGKNKSGTQHPMYGKHHTIEAKKMISLGHIGKSMGEQNWNWKGGVTSKNRMERVKFQKTIRIQVLKRDDYTCQLCGERGGDLQVDHIQGWAEYVDMRFCIDNCRTLCVKCHYKITYGKPMPPLVRAWGHNLMGGTKKFQ